MGAVFSFALNIRPPALRLVADRVAPPNTLTTAITQAMNRTSHTTVGAIADIALVIGNYYARNWNGGGAPAADTAVGHTASVTASIEYPEGVIAAQILFSASATGTVPDGDILVSDTAALSIPAATEFWVRIFMTNPSGIAHQGADYDGARGDRSNVGTSGVTDQTMGGTVANGGTQIVFPTAILGTTYRPAVAIVGTSIAAGVGGLLDPGDMRHGFSNWITAVPCINLAQGGATTLGWITDHPIHQKLLQYCTAMVTDHGTNDYFSVDTATAISRLQTLYALMPGKQIFQTTMLPRVTDSSDGFTSVPQIGQGGALGAPAFAAQKALNVAIRAGLANVTAVFDTDTLLESGFESGWWRAASDAHGNNAPFTLDGTHPTESAMHLVRDSGQINQSLIT